MWNLKCTVVPVITGATGIVTSASTRQKSHNNKYQFRVYSVELLLMMDSGHVRNM